MRILVLASVLGVVTGYVTSAGLTARASHDEPSKGYSLANQGGIGGLWVSQGDKGPTAALYAEKNGSIEAATLTFSRGPKDANGAPFAIAADKDRVYFQIRDREGNWHFIPVESLLKLKDKDEKVRAAVAAGPPR